MILEVQENKARSHGLVELGAFGMVACVAHIVRISVSLARKFRVIELIHVVRGEVHHPLLLFLL